MRPQRGSPPPAEGLQTGNYTPDAITVGFMNPDRGFHIHRDNSGDWSDARAANRTLVRSVARLDAYRSSAIPSSWLESHETTLEVARTEGIRLEYRYVYNWDWSSPDASLYWILYHIDQLASVWATHSDVFSQLQAGFIGAWGEWHSSTNGLTGSDPTGRNQVIDALLGALPDSRMVALRTPEAHLEYLGWDAFPAADRFTGTAAARLGLKNDGFLTNITDAGTFVANRYIGDWTFSQAKKDYWAQRAPYVSTTGETQDNPWLEGNRYAGSAAIAEMEWLNWDILNYDYWTSVYDGWVSSGHYTEINNRFGYRLALLSATVPNIVPASGSMQVKFVMRNDGFGKVFNPRPIDLVFVGSGGPFTVRLTSDARRDLPLGGEQVTMTYNTTAPSGLQSGESYDLHVRLPDAATAVEDDNRFAVRLANTGLWDGDTGRHDLGLGVSVPS